MPDLFKITNVLDKLPKWQRHITVFLSGVLASLALPPADVWPVLFVAFPVLVLMLDVVGRQAISPVAKFRASFVCGWLFGFGYFIVSLYWIGAAFLVEADKFAVLLPFAVAALPAGLAIFWGLATGLSMLAWRPGINRLLVLATVFTGFEWIRGHIFTGFPWNTIGYTSSGMGDVEQLAAFSGLYGVTFFVLICSFAPVLLFARQRDHAVIRILLSTLVAVWLLGNIRVFLGRFDVSPTDLTVRVVQPNIEQAKKWNRKFRAENIDKYFELSSTKPKSETGDPAGFDVLVWPESALPALFDEDPVLQARVAGLLPENTFLVMGSQRRERKLTPSGRQNRFYNSVLAVDSNGQVVGNYDKFHLVPFGEYLPGEKWLKPLGLRKIVALPGGFSSGPGARTLQIGKLPAFSPLVCYEIAFGNQVVDHNNRPDWIINVTNDGWFGKTAGPYQHLAQARFRAIEQGLPVVRAANTGISALIDPYGKIIKSLKLGKAGIFDAQLPKSIPRTVYARYGDLAAFGQIVSILMILTGLTNWSARVKKPGKRHNSDI